MIYTKKEEEKIGKRLFRIYIYSIFFDYFITIIIIIIITITYHYIYLVFVHNLLFFVTCLVIYN